MCTSYGNYMAMMRGVLWGGFSWPVDAPDLSKLSTDLSEWNAALEAHDCAAGDLFCRCLPIEQPSTCTAQGTGLMTQKASRGRDDSGSQSLCGRVWLSSIQRTHLEQASKQHHRSGSATAAEQGFGRREWPTL